MGLSTSIGKKSADIPWKKVKIVKDSGTFVLIAGINGNGFFIPGRAFASPDDHARFVEQVRIWQGRTN